MAKFDEDGRVIKQAAHEVGQDLAPLSEADLSARIEMLREEILRIETELAKKRSTRLAADAFFKLK